MTGMEHLRPVVDVLKAAFADETGFLDGNYTDIEDDGASRVVLDGQWNLEGIARALHAAGLLAPAPLREEWSTINRPEQKEMWSHMAWPAKSEEHAREAAHAFGYDLLHRWTTDWLTADDVDRATDDGSAEQ